MYGLVLPSRLLVDDVVDSLEEELRMELYIILGDCCLPVRCCKNVQF